MPGFVVNASIGQGDLTVTPMQLAIAYSAIVNGGRVFKPKLVREILDENGQVIEKLEPELVNTLSYDWALEIVRKGLSSVMSKGGTAYGLRWRKDLPELARWIRQSRFPIGGKTGTAQVVRLKKEYYAP